MEVIRITDGDLQRIANDIIDESNNIISGSDGCLSRLNGDYSEVAKAWRSHISTMFVYRLQDDYLLSLLRLSNAISDYSEFLKNVYAAYDAVEQEYSSKINSIGV